MNQRQAYRLGVDSGLEAAEYGDFTPAELQDEEAFLTGCFEICENKRQFAGHPGYDFARQANADGLWDEFDQGESVGIRRGWREREQQGRVYRKLDKLAEDLADHCCKRITKAEERYAKSGFKYMRQNTLEELIKKLEASV